MNIHEMEQVKEKIILKHDPWPGYRKVFYIVFGLALLYLLFMFITGYKLH